MKKYHVTAIIAAAMVITGAMLGKWNSSFWFGMLTGIGIFLGLTATLGQWLAAKAAERIDKLQRDDYEQVVNDN